MNGVGILWRLVGEELDTRTRVQGLDLRIEYKSVINLNWLKQVCSLLLLPTNQEED